MSVGERLKALGIGVQEGWLSQCCAFLRQRAPQLSDTELDKRVFSQFLSTDLNLIGAGVLPSQCARQQKGVLKGQFVLQVDATVDIAESKHKGEHKAGLRILKLSLTDGVQRVQALEFQTCPVLPEVVEKKSFKIALRDVQIRHGVILLVPDVFRVLGGEVVLATAAEGESKRGREGGGGKGDDLLENIPDLEEYFSSSAGPPPAFARNKSSEEAPSSRLVTSCYSSSSSSTACPPSSGVAPPSYLSSFDFPPASSARPRVTSGSTVSPPSDRTRGVTSPPDSPLIPMNSNNKPTKPAMTSSYRPPPSEQHYADMYSTPPSTTTFSAASSCSCSSSSSSSFARTTSHMNSSSSTFSSHTSHHSSHTSPAPTTSCSSSSRSTPPAENGRAVKKQRSMLDFMNGKLERGAPPNKASSSLDDLPPPLEPDLDLVAGYFDPPTPPTPPRTFAAASSRCSSSFASSSSSSCSCCCSSASCSSSSSFSSPCGARSSSNASRACNSPSPSPSSSSSCSPCASSSSSSSSSFASFSYRGSSPCNGCSNSNTSRGSNSGNNSSSNNSSSNNSSSNNISSSSSPSACSAFPSSCSAFISSFSPSPTSSSCCSSSCCSPSPQASSSSSSSSSSCSSCSSSSSSLAPSRNLAASADFQDSFDDPFDFPAPPEYAPDSPLPAASSSSSSSSSSFSSSSSSSFSSFSSSSSSSSSYPPSCCSSSASFPSSQAAPTFDFTRLSPSDSQLGENETKTVENIPVTGPTKKITVQGSSRGFSLVRRPVEEAWQFLDEFSTQPMRVKAIVSNTLGFSHEGSEYDLAVMIDDGTAAKAVRLGNDLVAGLLGCPCRELNSMSEDDRNARLEKLEVLLPQLEGVMSLVPSQPLPLVVKLEPPTRMHALALLRRLKQQSVSSSS